MTSEAGEMGLFIEKANLTKRPKSEISFTNYLLFMKKFTSRPISTIPAI
jgi:D-alanyl-lipoteichoic acid acyltransferase DltB (MBOAT superfamily)